MTRKMMKIQFLAFAVTLLMVAQSALAQVTEEWVARYNGPGSHDDRAVAIAIDAAGNVYVTGPSNGSGTDWDYATIKYDSNGNQLWLARYNGPGNGLDRANDLAIDAAGNVYVTGRSSGLDTFGDYATIKYDPSGNQLWVARHNGPDNGYDMAYRLAVDAAGNVYVTGRSSFDFGTIKYDTNGNELWVARCDFGSDDSGTDLAVDAAGNVYVTGRNGTVKYDTSGNELWRTSFAGNDLAPDAGGNVYVTGGSGGDFATVKYDASGNELWVASYNGPGNSDDYAEHLVVDATGNVYVAGRSQGSGTDWDYATIKYDSNGNQLWLARYNGPANIYDYSNAIAVDAAGNVYVTGLSGVVAGNNTDHATIKYDPSGNQLWVTRHDGPANGNDGAIAIAVDAAGNVYVAGDDVDYGTGDDYVTIKYSQSHKIAALNVTQNDKQRLVILNAPTPGNNETGASIAYDVSFGSAIDDFRFTSIAGVDIDGDGVDEIAALNVMQNDKQRLVILNAPTPGNNETGAPIAYDTSFGSAIDDFRIISIAGVDIDGDGVDEIAAFNVMQNDKQRLAIFNAPTPGNNETGAPIAYDVSFGNATDDFRIIAIAGVDIDGDGVDEIAALNVMQNDKQRLVILNAPTPGNNETGAPIAYDTSFGSAIDDFRIISIAGVDIDGDGVDEIAALNLMQNDKQRLAIFNAPTPGNNKTGPVIAYDASFGNATDDFRIMSITGISQ